MGVVTSFHLVPARLVRRLSRVRADERPEAAAALLAALASSDAAVALGLRAGETTEAVHVDTAWPEAFRAVRALVHHLDPAAPVWPGRGALSTPLHGGVPLPPERFRRTSALGTPATRFEGEAWPAALGDAPGGASVRGMLAHGPLRLARLFERHDGVPEGTVYAEAQVRRLDGTLSAEAVLVPSSTEALRRRTARALGDAAVRRALTAALDEGDGLDAETLALVLDTGFWRPMALFARAWMRPDEAGGWAPGGGAIVRLTR